MESHGDTFALQLLHSDQVEAVTIEMDGPRRLELVFKGQGAPTFPLVWESSEQAVPEPQELTIGSNAPAIDVEHLLNETPFPGRFEPGRVYLVDFWATWCPPCLKAMPELALLQDRLRDQGLVVIAISNEGEETVAAFLRRALPDADEAGPRTLGDLTSDIVVASDPDGTSVRDYLVASHQRALPVAFVIGKSGRIEWIGHSLEEAASVVRRVAEDRWDRDGFSETFARRQSVESGLQQVMLLDSKGNHREARRLIQQLLPLAEGPVKEQLRRLEQTLEGPTQTSEKAKQ